MSHAAALRGAWLLVVALLACCCCTAAEDDVRFVDAVAVPVQATGARRRLQALPNLNRTLNTPSNCAEWPEPRMYIESQAWFTRPGADINLDSTHLHVGACMPHRQRVRGDLTFHVLVQKHQFPNNGTEAAKVDLVIELLVDVTRTTQSKYTVTSSALNQKATKWDCNAAKTLCKGVAAVTIPTAGNGKVFVPNGFTKVTIMATHGSLDDGVAPRSFQARASAFFVIDNKQNQPWPLNSTLGVHQLANSPFPWGYTHAHVMSDLPTGPVSGSWTFVTNHFTAGAAAVTSNVTGVFISLDPNFHSPASGPDFTGKQVLVNAEAVATPANCPVIKGHMDCAFQTTVNTATLTDGAHKLFIRTDSFVNPASSLLVNKKTNGGTFSSVTLIVFKVCNNPAGCPTDATVPVDEASPPPLPPFTPPPGATWYNGSQKLPPQTLAADQPYNCSLWLGSRVYQEGQVWFTPPGRAVGGNSTQLHVGACLPYRGMVAGQVPVDILVSKYNFPSLANATVSMRMTFYWKSGNISFELRETGSAKGWACRNNAPVCRVVYRTMIDTRPPSLRWIIPDGVNRIELEANYQFHDGVASRAMMARAESYTVVANSGATDVAGKPLPPSILSRGSFPWRDGRVTLTSDPPAGAVAGPFTVKFTVAHTGRTGTNVTGVLAAVDPSPTLRPTPFPGFVLVNASTTNGLPLAPFAAAAPAVNCVKASGDNGSLACTVTGDPSAVPKSCAFNPCNGGLCDGLHRLMLRMDSYVEPQNPAFRDLPPGGQVGAGTLSTLLVLPFVTSNGLTVDVAGCSASPITARAAAVASGDSVVGTMSSTVASILARDMVKASVASSGRVDAANAVVRAGAASAGPVSLRLMTGRVRVVEAPAADPNDDPDGIHAAAFA